MGTYNNKNSKIATGQDFLMLCALYTILLPYVRTRLDGYLTKTLGIVALLYFHIVDYSNTFEVF